MQVQLFEMTSVGGSEDLYRFKATINNWLSSNEGKIEIKDVQQSLVTKQGALSSMISIWYEPVPKEEHEEQAKENSAEKKAGAFPAI